MNRISHKSKKGTLVGVAAVLLSALVLLALFWAVGVFSGKVQNHGAELVRDSVVRAAVLCYSTEGYYPPSLAYIEENYNVAIDHQKYLVWYKVFASNIMPTVQVVERK